MQILVALEYDLLRENVLLSPVLANLLCVLIRDAVVLQVQHSELAVKLQLTEAGV